MHEALVNRLGGLSLPRKSVVRLTDHPDMTLDGRKTTMQQQQQIIRGGQHFSDFTFAFPGSKILLTHCILVDSSTVICWMGPFVILGVSGLFCYFYSIFGGKSC